MAGNQNQRRSPQQKRIHKHKAVRWPVSRVLFPHAGDGYSSSAAVASSVERPTRTAAQDRACRPKAARVPTWSCSGWGLPCPARYRPGGALLPHLFTLTSIRPVGRMGGLFSAALSLGSPPPGVTRHPDPVEPGLSSPTGFLRWWQRSSGHLTAA